MWVCAYCQTDVSYWLWLYASSQTTFLLSSSLSSFFPQKHLCHLWRGYKTLPHLMDFPLTVKPKLSHTIRWKTHQKTLLTQTFVLLETPSCPACLSPPTLIRTSQWQSSKRGQNRQQCWLPTPWLREILTRFHLGKRCHLEETLHPFQVAAVVTPECLNMLQKNIRYVDRSICTTEQLCASSHQPFLVCSVKKRGEGVPANFTGEHTDQFHLPDRHHDGGWSCWGEQAYKTCRNHLGCPCSV